MEKYYSGETTLEQGAHKLLDFQNLTRARSFNRRRLSFCFLIRFVKRGRQKYYSMRRNRMSFMEWGHFSFKAGPAGSGRVGHCPRAWLLLLYSLSYAHERDLHRSGCAIRIKVTGWLTRLGSQLQQAALPAGICR